MGDFDQQLEAFADQLERQAERDAEREERKARAAEPQLSPEERERRLALEKRRRGLDLARARVVADLAVASAPRYREQLERSLAALDAEIAGLDA
jgi:hypothetical protein